MLISRTCLSPFLDYLPFAEGFQGIFCLLCVTIVQKFEVTERRYTNLQVTRSTQRVKVWTMRFPKAQVRYNTARENLKLFPATRATLSYDSIG